MFQKYDSSLHAPHGGFRFQNRQYKGEFNTLNAAGFSRDLIGHFEWRPLVTNSSMVSCQMGPTRHAYAWQIEPFWQDTLELLEIMIAWEIQHWVSTEPGDDLAPLDAKSMRKLYVYISGYTMHRWLSARLQ